MVPVTQLNRGLPVFLKRFAFDFCVFESPREIQLRPDGNDVPAQSDKSVCGSQ